MKKGILAAGNWIIDEVKMVDTYPEEEKLANILAEYKSNGGCAYNILKSLSRLRVPFPLEGIGLIGEDERGGAILEDCSRHKISTKQLRQVPGINTSYTQVMTVKATGKRTFFHQRGANALLSGPDFDFTASSCKILHLGYLLLLDKLDVIASDGCTGASKVLKAAKEHGFITSVDIVSENSDRFKDIVPSSLPFVDYLFVNEYEATKLSKVKTISGNGEVNIPGCIKAAANIMEMGVREYVILHFPEGVIATNSKGECVFQPSIHLPAKKIIGAVGAGDAFAAGVLIGVHEGWEMGESLALGVCAAASSLLGATSSDSILPFQECLRFPEQYGFRKEVSITDKISLTESFNPQ